MDALACFVVLLFCFGLFFKFSLSVCFTCFCHCIPGFCDSRISFYSPDLSFDVLVKSLGPGFCFALIYLLMPPFSPYWVFLAFFFFPPCAFLACHRILSFVFIEKVMF